MRIGIAHRSVLAAGLATAVAVIALLAVDAAKTDSPTDQTVDITFTTKGRQLREEAVQRRQADGIAVSPDELKVVQLGDREDYVIIPADMDPGEVGFGDDGRVITMSGSFVIRGDDTIPDNGPKQVSTQPILAQAPYWQMVNSHCYDRLYAPWDTWMDTCWVLWFLQSDGLPTRDYYTVDIWATVYSPRMIDYAWIETDESPWGDPQYWADWDPKSDSTGGCSYYTISVGIYGVGVSRNLYRCETWRITKHADPAHFRSKYDGDVWGATRFVGHMIMTYIDGGDTPIWVVSYEVRACYLGCGSAGGP